MLFRSILDAQSYLKGITDKHGSIYIESVIPKGTYAKLDQDVKTLAVPVIFVTTEATDEKLVYNITKLLFDKKADLVAVYKEAQKLTLQNAVAVPSVPYHPGAIRYYKEQGAWK